MMEAMIKDVILSFEWEYPSDETRNKIADKLSKEVFAGMTVTDISTPEEVADLILVFAIDLPNNGQQKVLQIETANGVLDRDNIKTKLQ